MPNRRVRVALVATLLTAAGVVAGPIPTAQAANSTLVVNVAAPFRPVTHAASGGLYALAENDRPADSMLYPIHLRNVVQPAPGVQQRPNGQPPGGDSLKVAQQAIRVGAGYPPTAGWAQFGTVSTTVNLRAGPNTIRLAKGSPFFAGGTRFAELDYIHLT